jgi:polysaccharide export outer membrane protein
VPEYLLQREDIIRIQILDRDQAEVNTEVQVGRDGRITPPFLAPVVVEGLSINAIRRFLTTEYERELQVENVKVSVVLVRVREMRASVVGAVRTPGSFNFRPGDTVLTLLSIAGDALGEAQADLRRATLTRSRSREIIPLDVVALRAGDLSQNYELMDGDILNIPQEQGLNRVLVWGKVRQPGAFPFIDGMTVMDALTQAGGDIPNQSKFSKVQVLREVQGAPGTYQRITCNIVDYVRKGDFRQNIKLQRRDVVVVPDSGNPNFDQFNQIISLIFVLERFGINIFRF